MTEKEMTMDYLSFLKSKQKNYIYSGFDVAESELNPAMFPFQRFIVQRALHVGKYAIFADCGLGKTIMQLEWARHVNNNTGKPVLILCPLAVSGQTIQEGRKFHIDVCRYDGSNTPIQIINYEQIDNIDCSIFGGIVLDESGILKNFEGMTKKLIIESFKNTPYKLACTATPAPNDPVELGNHSEFLDVMGRNEMLAMYFVHDGGETSKWRLKGHAHKRFYEFISTWAIMLSKPSDIGFENKGYDLPELNYIERQIITDKRDNGKLFNDTAISATNFNQELRLTKKERLEAVVSILEANPNERFIVWIKQNEEGELLRKMIPCAVEVKGSDSNEWKESKLLEFANNKYKYLITKSKIAGHGLNYQSCHNQIFASLDFCYSEDTEVLTHDGWKYFTELKKGEEVATVNQQTLHFEWQITKNIWNEYYVGELHHYKGRKNFDLLVTPNHNLFVKKDPFRHPSSDGKYVLRKSKDVVSNYKRMGFNMLTTSKGFIGNKVHQNYIEIPDIKPKMNRVANKINKIEINDFCELVGWYLSEGSVNLQVKSNNRSCGVISITQSEQNKEYRNEIVNLIKRITNKKEINTKWKELHICGNNIALYFANNFGIGSRGKKIPEWVKDLDIKYLSIIRDTMLKGDGCKYKGKVRSYRTVCKKLADDFQEICIKTGIRANVKKRNIKASFGINGRVDIYDVQLSWQQIEPYISVKPDIINYKGYVGCCEVDNHTLIVRRNGMVCVSGNSFEATYQSIRRSYRFGQDKPVNIYMITTDTMLNVSDSISRKQTDFEHMQHEMSQAVNSNLRGEMMTTINYDNDDIKTEYFNIRRGDCVRLIQDIDNESMGFSVFSPPFADLYTYSSHLEDMGNCRDYNDFMVQFGYLVKELHRVLMQGRNVAVHCMDLPIQKGKHGFIGLRDFSGMILKCFDDVGFIYHSRITIWKNPVTEMQRTKALGLLHKQIKKDSTMSRVGIPDYVMIFRKDGERDTPVTNTEMSVDTWQKIASPVWMDIDYGNTLQGYRDGREDQDERHICPLQLDTIERLITLYTNRGDTVLTPFMGIGSEVYQAVKMGRYGVGFELKESYYDVAKKNLRLLLETKKQMQII